MLDHNKKENKGISVLSCFDGISCARVALDRDGIEVDKYFASEIDKYAIQVSQKNYPDIEHIGDVTKIKSKNFKNIDLVIGGFPCQSFSIAGNRKGFLDDRGKLFYEFKRIISEAQPKYFIGENVASMSKETQKIISEELWGIEPVMIDAALVSAQRRRRLFWVGRWNGKTYEKVDIAQPKDRGIFLKDIVHETREEYFDLEKYIIRGNHLEWISQPERLKKKYTQIGGDKAITMTARQYASWNGNYVAVSIRGRYLVDGKRKDVKGAKTAQRIEISESRKAHTITSVQKDSLLLHPTFGVRKFTPVECERLQSLPDGYTEGVSDTQRYRQLGNAFNVEVVKHILKSLLDN